ncbi:MAG: adenylate/guanylate cyclase domain-containing protein, partial [Thermoanaerobaculia bacterium]|nr:adenylate/guanylate cyclase domain-containing protein [Thermoanaerobaculia bacterium]
YGLEESLYEPGMETKERVKERAERDEAYSSKIFSFLTRLARLLIQANTVEEVLEKVFDIAFEALDVDRGFILLRDEESGELVCELSREGERVEIHPEGDIPVSHTMLEEVMRERVALLTYDAQADQRLVTGESIRIHQIRSAMCAPLWSGKSIIGVMQVDSPFHAGTFNEGDLDLFTALANYAAVAVERIRYAQRVEFERQIRSRLERYHSPAVIDLVLKQGEDVNQVQRTLEQARVSVLFADVVGFTALAENLPPDDVAEILGDYFNQSVEAIFNQGGTLDKFIGDCVMAFFGAPVAQPDHAARGVRAAIEIQRKLEAWNRRREEEGDRPVRARIAVNTGPVVVGDVGSSRRVDYTILGNTVNVAARLEAAAADPGEIVVGGATFGELDDSIPVEPLGEIQLKGLQKRVPAYRVLWREES